MKIGIDLDGTINASRQSVGFFTLLTKLFFDCAAIFLFPKKNSWEAVEP